MDESLSEMSFTPEQRKKQFANLNSVAYDAFSSAQDVLIQYVRNAGLSKREELSFLDRMQRKLNVKSVNLALRDCVDAYFKQDFPRLIDLVGETEEKRKYDGNVRKETIGVIVRRIIGEMSPDLFETYGEQTKDFFIKLFSSVLSSSEKYSEFGTLDPTDKRNKDIADITLAKIIAKFEGYYTKRQERKVGIKERIRDFL